MVAIKIQSKEDIIGAYLCSLGFAGRELPSIVKTVAGQLDFQSADGDELVGKIDGILLEMARKTFPESGLADEHCWHSSNFAFCSAAAPNNVPSRASGS